MITKKQQNEIDCLDYFKFNISHYNSDVPLLKITEDVNGDLPEECYFFITDNGIKSVTTTNQRRLKQLLDAKKWRLRFMDMYEQGVLEGSPPYYTLLGFEPEIEIIEKHLVEFPCEPIPRVVMNFMARTMFKGYDKQLIKEIYVALC